MGSMAKIAKLPPRNIKRSSTWNYQMVIGEYLVAKIRQIDAGEWVKIKLYD